MATIASKVGFVAGVLPIILSKTMAAAATAAVMGPSGAHTRGEYITNTAMRSLLGAPTAEQLQWLMPPFKTTYLAWCKKNNVEPEVVSISSKTVSTEAFWVGNRSTAKKIMVFCHGGGFTLPGNEGHLNLAKNLVKWSNDNLAVLCVDYTLSPAAIYPYSIAQCVESLRYVLSLPGQTPSNTLLGGDSAGGALTLGVLSHLHHPHPNSEIMQPLTIKEDLFGVVITSPWISSDNIKYKSMDRLADRDIFSTATAQYWMGNYKGRGKNIPDDEFIDAASAEASWWKGAKCARMLATVADEEIIHDSVIAWAEKFQKGTSPKPFELAIGKGETHIMPVMAPKPEDELIRLGRDAQEGAIRLWVMENLG